jgi:hypothetical protein
MGCSYLAAAYFFVPITISSTRRGVGAGRA